MKKKTQAEIEQIAFNTLRSNADKKLLSNTTVTCFTMGYEKSQNEYFVKLLYPEEIITWALTNVEDARDYIENSAGYAGRYYTKEEELRDKILSKIHNALSEISDSDDMKAYLELKSKK